MPRYPDIVALMIGVLLAGLVSAAPSEVSKSVHIRGSTTLLPIIQRLGEAYMRERPEACIVVSGGGTARGYKAILEGTADIAMASGAVPEDLVSDIERKGIKLHSTIVSYDVIVPLVNAANPIGNLSLKQLKNIFTGRITNWKDVGGKNAPIEVYVGPPTGGISDTWKRLILGEDDTYTPSRMVLNTNDRMARVAKHPLAISYLTKTPLRLPHLKLLSVDGIVADAANTNYPLRVPLMLVTAETPSATAKDFTQMVFSQSKTLQLDGGEHE